MGKELNGSIFSRAVSLFSMLVSGPLTTEEEDGQMERKEIGFHCIQVFLESHWSIRTQGDGSTLSHNHVT